MLTTTGTLLAADGTRLYYREWPADRPRATLVLLHGLGDHGGRYVHVARRLNSRGISVRAPDLRGHGRSDGPRGTLNKATDLLSDLKLIFDDYALQQGTTPFLLGQGVGGLLAANFAMSGLSPVRGLILASPALQLRLSMFESLFFATASILLPNLAIDTRLSHEKISHDPSVLVDVESDKFNHTRITAGLVSFILNAIDQINVDARMFAKPTLLLVAGDDQRVNPKGCRTLFEHLPEHGRTLCWYDDAYHELFHETSERRIRVLNDLCNWIDIHVPKPIRI